MNGIAGSWLQIINLRKLFPKLFSAISTTFLKEFTDVTLLWSEFSVTMTILFCARCFCHLYSSSMKLIVCFILDSFDENVLLQNYKFFFHCCNSILKGNGECSFCNSIFNLIPGKILYFLAVSFLLQLGRL